MENIADKNPYAPVYSTHGPRLIKTLPKRNNY